MFLVRRRLREPSGAVRPFAPDMKAVAARMRTRA